MYLKTATIESTGSYWDNAQVRHPAYGKRILNDKSS